MTTSAHAGQENRAVLERREGGVATLILNRPERMNALNADLVLALNDALRRIDGDQDVAVVVLVALGPGCGRGRKERQVGSLGPGAGRSSTG